MLASAGPQGRFNRAKRGVFNFDEVMPVVLANIAFAGFVFGPIIACLALLIGYGRVQFGLKYKEEPKGRIGGFMMTMVGEKWIEGLVLLCAIKSIFYTSIKF